MQNRTAFATDPVLTIVDMQNIQTELQTLITAFGGSLSGSDLTQVSKAISDAVSNSSYYADSGAANAYVLSAVAGSIGQSTLRTGSLIRFMAANANSGASTINVASLGVKAIKRADGSTALSANDITTTEYTHLIYDGTNWRILSFGLIQGSKGVFTDRIVDKTGYLSPVGEIKMFAGASAPNGFLICDGSAISRTNYADLFAITSTTYGVGDGTTTFNLPDMRETYAVGVGTRGSGITAHDIFTLGQFKDDQTQGHKHLVDRGDGSQLSTYSGTGAAGTLKTESGITKDYDISTLLPISDGTNGTPRTGTTTRGKAIGVNYIIKY